jgi:hypothetical protein
VSADSFLQRRKFGCPAAAAAQKNPLAGQQAAIAAGENIYASTCSKCHGDQGHGTGPVPSLANGRAQKAKVGEFFWLITPGDEDNGMPSWASLSDQQRWQVGLRVPIPRPLSCSASLWLFPSPKFSRGVFAGAVQTHPITLQTGLAFVT